MRKKSHDCMGFGKYPKRSIGQIIFNHPDFAIWMLSCSNPTGSLELAADEARTLIRCFDNKPLTCKCRQKDCNETATEIYIYKNSLILHCWCADCADKCANGLFREINGYKEAVYYAKNRCDAEAKDAKRLVHDLAKAKGYSGRFSKENVRLFLTGSSRYTSYPCSQKRPHSESYWMREERV